MKTSLHVSVLLTALIATSAAATASDIDVGFRRFGVRGGVSMNPDQFHGGVFIDAGRILSTLRLQPSVELGLGNGVRLLTTNVDVLYPVGGSRWRPYVGGGVGLNFVDVTNGVGSGRGSELETVLNLVSGVEWGGGSRGSRSRYRYVVEGRVGVGETPDFKLGFGVAF